VIDGDRIKAEAKAGRMGQQLIALAVKNAADFTFRALIPEDEAAYPRATNELAKRRPAWEAADLIPNERRRVGRADWACEIYGATRWCDTFTPRQLLAIITIIDCLRETVQRAEWEVGHRAAEAIQTYLALAVDKVADYNSRQCSWHATRQIIRNAFARHDLGMRWSITEFDASRNLIPWVLNQVVDAYSGIAALASTPKAELFGSEGSSPVDRLRFTQGNAAALNTIELGSIRLITVDPPYYDNVNYAECSNYFYVMDETYSRRCVPGTVHQ
jgi:putative DNA methylase